MNNLNKQENKAKNELHNAKNRLHKKPKRITTHTRIEVNILKQLKRYAQENNLTLTRIFDDIINKFLAKSTINKKEI